MDYLLYDELNAKIENLKQEVESLKSKADILEGAIRGQKAFNNEVARTFNILIQHNWEPTYGPMIEEGEEHS